MYCLIEENGKRIKVIAVSKDFDKLNLKLKETAKEFVTPRYDGETLADMLYEIEETKCFWMDEDEKHSYALIIMQTEEI